MAVAAPAELKCSRKYLFTHRFSPCGFVFFSLTCVLEDATYDAHVLLFSTRTEAGEPRHDI
jgi:hypothetical protein